MNTTGILRVSAFTSPQHFNAVSTEFTPLDTLTTSEPSNRLSRFDEGRFDLIIGNYVIEWMEIIIITILCGVIGTAGIVANIINVIIFFRQKVLTSSSNMSLFALAICDIGSLVPLIGNSINYAIYNLNKDIMLFLTPQDVTEIFFLWPHIMFVQISSWITVYIAFERCLSVVFPLKVRMIFSPKRSLLVVSSIAVVVALSFVPIYTTTRVEEMQDFDTNATKLIFSLNPDQFEVVDVSNVIHSVVLRILAVTIVFICTQITVYKVRLSTKWRTKLTEPTHTKERGTVSDGKNRSSGTIKSELEDSEQQTTSTSQIESVDSTSSQTIFTTANTTPNTTVNDAPTPTVNPTPAPPTNPTPAPPTKPTPRPNATSTTTTTTTITNNRPKSAHASSTKEQRLVKLITMISTIFLVCNLPEIVGILTLIVMENFYGISPWDNLIHMITYVQFFSESINASINIFVYYKMGTNYRLHFRRLFRLD